MAVKLSSLRVTADMDASQYVRAAKEIGAASETAARSVKEVGQALAAADAAAGKNAPGVASLSRSFVTGYGEAAKFEAAIRRVGQAMDRGMDAGRAAAALDNIYRKFGQTADATVMARQGFTALVPVVSALNDRYETTAAIADRAAAATKRLAEAQRAQQQINATLGVREVTGGAARSSADAFMAGVGGLDGVAAAQARQVADTFAGDLQNRLITGTGKAARESASVFATELDRLDTIARQKAEQTGQNFGRALNERLMTGASKSARDSASVFQDQFAEQDRAIESLRRLRAEFNPLGAAIRANSERIETYNTLLAQGRITQEEYGHAVTWSNRQFDLTKRAIDGTNFALGKYVSGTGLARNELVNMSRQAQDVFVSLASGQAPLTVLIQQGTQIADIFASSQGSVTGFFTQVATGAARFAVSVTGMVTGLAALGGASALAGYQYAEGQREIERALVGVGRQSGLTVGQINRMSTAYAEAAKVSNATAREMIAAFGSTGAMGAGGIAGTAGLTRNFAAFTSTGATEAAKALAAAFVDPTKGAQELNRQIGFLDAKTLEYIRTAQSQGRTGEAQRALADALGNSIQGAADRTSGLARAWNSVWNAASNAWDALGKAVSGQISLEERLTQLIIARRQAEGRRSRFGSAGALAEFDTGISDVQEQIRRQKAQADRDARNARQNAASTGALSVLDELNPFGAELRKLETMAAALKKGLTEAGAALNPEQARAVAEAYERIQRAIQAALPPAERQRQMNELTVQSINARTVAERTSVEIGRLQMDSAFKLKDTEEQRAIILGKIVELQTQANREARDALRSSQDQANLAGLRPYERRMAEIAIRERDNRERFGIPAASSFTYGAGGYVGEGPFMPGSAALPATSGALRGLDAAFAESLRRAMADIPGLTITGGMRTYEQQAALYAQKGPGLAARPGTSNHEMKGGLPATAADLAYNGSGQIPREIRERLTRDYNIAFPLAYRTRGTPEPWHAEPVGGRGRGDAASSIANAERAAAATENYSSVIRSANDNISEQERALQIQARALTASAYETGRAEKAQELYNQLAANGVPVTRELANAIAQTADRYGRLREAAASVKLTQDVQFERDQIGRSSGEQQIASRLRGTGVGMDSAIADQMRFNQVMGETKSLAGDAMKGFISDLRSGKSMMEALQGVLDRFINKLFDLATDQLISSLFKGVMGAGGGGGWFGSILGLGGGGGGLGLTPGAGGLYANGGVFSPGGVHAFASGGIFTNSIVDRPTQFRFANGGALASGLMGEAGPEAIMPLRRGSDGRLGVSAPGLGHVASQLGYPSNSNAAGPVSVQIINKSSGQVQGEARTERGPDGSTNVFIEMVDAVESAIAQRAANGRSPLNDVYQRDGRTMKG